MDARTNNFSKIVERQKIDKRTSISSLGTLQKLKLHGRVETIKIQYTAKFFKDLIYKSLIEMKILPTLLCFLILN